jgi:hypothetical protein
VCCLCDSVVVLAVRAFMFVSSVRDCIYVCVGQGGGPEGKSGDAEEAEAKGVPAEVIVCVCNMLCVCACE